MDTQETPSTTADTILDGYLTEQELAAQLGRTRRSLSDWRRRRQGPNFVKIGPSVFYHREAVQAWLRGIETKTRPGRSA